MGHQLVLHLLLLVALKAIVALAGRGMVHGRLWSDGSLSAYRLVTACTPAQIE